MKKHNFNAGPSILPEVVYEKTARAILDFNGTGLSILSISHRSKEFDEVMAQADSLLRELDVEESVIHAVVSHGWGVCSEVEPERYMEKILFATDELTGLIWAASLMRPRVSKAWTRNPS